MALRTEPLLEPIPGYRLLERLGVGGFGEVWKAEAPGGLLKAIKFVHGDLHGPDGQELQASQELNALHRVKSVRHPYILSLERYDIIDGQLLIVMELADRNMWDRFKECRSQGLPGIPREELLRYLEEAAEALDLMRDRYQLQHLDIKPQNLFLVHQHVKIADFGLVNDLEEMKGQFTSGVTPLYAAPETFNGALSSHCDQYSLAIVYVEMLTGRRPFDGVNLRQLMMQQMAGIPDLAMLPPSDRLPIHRALAKKPEDRFASCTELVRALRQTRAGETLLAIPAEMAPGAPAATTPAHHYNGLPATPVEIALPPEAARLSPGFLDPVSSSVPLSVLKAELDKRRVVDARPAPAPKRPKQPEKTGAGVLHPALILSIGGMALGVVKELRQALSEQCASLNDLPLFRFLHLDTDPQAPREASSGIIDAKLQDKNVLVTRLNRPVHYLKHIHGRPNPESWLNPKMVYRIPRQQNSTDGVRSLGRLALIDHYFPLSARLQDELEACASADNLASAQRRTALGLRSNWPRVYVIASLGGGTGSGMFLDLAYIARHHLRNLGYDPPHVEGLLLLPPVKGNQSDAVTLGNTYAALTELHHFSSPHTTFSGHYSEADWPITDSDAPFTRCVLIPTEGHHQGSPAEKQALTAHYLCRQLLTPLGRHLDQAGEQTAAVAPFQTFGMHWINWPRQALVHHVSRRLAFCFARDWLEGDPKADVVRATSQWLSSEWERRGLSAPRLTERVGHHCVQAVGQSVESAIAATTASVASHGMLATKVDADAALRALEQLHQLVGRPENVGPTAAPSLLADAVQQASRAIQEEAHQHLRELVLAMIDAPHYRLPAAEEMLQQVRSAVQSAWDAQEAARRQLTRQAAESYSRLHTLLFEIQQGSSWFGRKAKAAAEFEEALRRYPLVRHQELVARAVAAVYGHLLEKLPPLGQELECCRERLQQLARHWKNLLAQEETPRSSCGQSLFPQGCRNLNDAIAWLCESITDAELDALEQQVQEQVARQYRSLAHLCLDSDDHLDELEEMMQRQAEEFVRSKLSPTGILEQYQQRVGSPTRLSGDLAGMFDEATPELARGQADLPPEIAVLASPDGDKGEQLRQAARAALPDVPLMTLTSPDEICFYREQRGLSLADLPQYGTNAQAAYQQMLSQDESNPHSRMDIFDWIRPISW